MMTGQVHKRFNFEPDPLRQVTRLSTIESGDITNADEIWKLGGYYRHSQPYLDAIQHLLKQKKNVCSLHYDQTVLLQKEMKGETEISTGVVHEELTGSCIIAPASEASLKRNYHKARLALFLRRSALDEESAAKMIYEALYHYGCTIETEGTTQLELVAWLSPLEHDYFKIVVGYLDAFFHDSYLNIQVSQVHHDIWMSEDSKKPKSWSKDFPKAGITAGVLKKERRQISLESFYYEHRHTIVFPRLPGPMK